LDGAKIKKGKLGLDFEFEAEPKLNFFFIPFEFFFMPTKVWM
jgi:hypothetical protein